MTPTHVVSELIPYAHVADVQRSIDFYGRLGFEPTDVSLDEGATVWALIQCGEARLMVAQAGEPVVPEQQAILFYLFTPDLAALRGQLVDAGVPVGEIGFPDYMPGGEMRLEDPDRYVLLIAQR